MLQHQNVQFSAIQVVDDPVGHLKTRIVYAKAKKSISQLIEIAVAPDDEHSVATFQRAIDETQFCEKHLSDEAV
jgi:hypothetical protein